MTVYAIDDGYGNQITTGLPAHTARKTAQRIANERGESVWLYSTPVRVGADGDPIDESQEISPTGSAFLRRCAEILNARRVPLTADTITDDDIRKLRDWYDAMPQSITRRTGVEACDLALGDPDGDVKFNVDGDRMLDEHGQPRGPNEAEIKAARDHCARILNVRNDLHR